MISLASFHKRETSVLSHTLTMKQDSTFHNFTTRSLLQVDQMTSNLSRSFGPLLGVLFVNFLSKIVTAKYAPYAALDFPHDWNSKPQATYNQHTHYYPQWYPIENPYENVNENYPTLTPQPPSAHEDYVEEYAEENKKNAVVTTLDKPNRQHGHVAEASTKVKTVASSSRRRNQYQKRRRPTTPSYYDSYEDTTTERYYKRRRPYRDSFENYDDDSIESTTKVLAKQRKRNKNKKRRGETTENSSYPEFDSGERNGPQTEIVIVRQAQTTTTTTTTEPTTLITNGTTPTASTSTTGSTTTNYSSYGYGPSNGNEGISFTYGPPVNDNRFQQTSPYIDYYAQQNPIVKRVRDLLT